MMSLDTSDVSFVNDSFILNESLQELESNESSQKKDLFIFSWPGIGICIGSAKETEMIR